MLQLPAVPKEIKSQSANSASDTLPRFSRADLDELRLGQPGRIRTDLTPEKVAAVLNEQLMRFSRQDIKDVIDSFPPNLRRHARYVLYAISGFASLEGL